MINESRLEAERYGKPGRAAGEAPKRPVRAGVRGGKASGVVSLQNLDREDVFTDSDQRLLVTSGSPSVAQNARLSSGAPAERRAR
jgi:hypothetical protein